MKTNNKQKTLKIAIAVSRFNPSITERLLASCKEELDRHGIGPHQIHTKWAPGAYELPFLAHHLAKTKRFKAIICIGCIMKGETSQNQHIATWVSIGVGQASLMTGIPIVFGVITPDSEEQAYERAKEGPLNRGVEAAQAALSMIESIKKEGRNGI